MIYTMVMLVVLAIVDIAGATTWYVGKSGSDANSCATAQSSTAANRKLTINAALTCVDSNRGNGASTAGAGHTVEVGAGIYAEVIDQNLFTNPPGGTSWASPFTLKAGAGETVTLKPTSGACTNRTSTRSGLACNNLDFWNVAYVIIDRINLDATNVAYDNLRISCTTGVTVECANHIRFTDSTWVGSESNCAIVYGSFNEFIRLNVSNCGDNDPSYGGHNSFYILGSDNLVEYSTVHDSANGILSWSDLYTPSRNVFRNNLVYNMEGDLSGGGAEGVGIGLYKGTDSAAYNNIIYHANGNCVTVRFGCTGCMVYNNTIDDCYHGSAGVGIDIDTTANGTIARNNIVINTNNADIDDRDSNTTKSNNLCDSGCNINADPLFTNEAGHVYTLTSSSPARDAGTNTLCPSVDYAGTARPQNSTCDIGAYEYSAGGGGGGGGMTETPSWSSPRRPSIKWKLKG